MRKLFFYFSLLVSIVLTINIINILTNDFNRLTEYGYGYLAGKVILLVVFGVVAFITKSSYKKSENNF